MKKLYLCGKIGNGKSFEEEMKEDNMNNIRNKFNEAENQLRQKGYDVWNPIKEVPNPISRKDALKKDILGIFECDGIAMIDENDIGFSLGTYAEMAVAQGIELPVYLINHWLKEPID